MRRLLLALFMIALLPICGCTTAPTSPTEAMNLPSEDPTEAPTLEETQEPTQEEEPMLKLTIGEHTIHAALADNTAANQLKELLQNGPIAMPASNYGGFEKVCELGTNLDTEDEQTTTVPGDIMLWAGDHIVIFYGSNTWAYTRLAWVVGEDIHKLEVALSGTETEVTIELE